MDPLRIPTTVPGTEGLDSLLLLRLAIRGEQQKATKYAERQLLAAAERKQFEMVIALAKAGANVNARREDGTTPLMMAVTRRAAAEILEKLILKGADVNAHENRYEMSVLLLAIANKADRASIELLLRHGADVEATNMGGRTTLMVAAQYGGIDILNILLDRANNVNRCDRKGRTALMIAAEHGTLAMVKALRSHGANQRLLNHSGESALHYAVYGGSPEVVKVLIPGTALQINRVQSLIRWISASDRSKPTKDTIAKLLQKITKEEESHAFDDGNFFEQFKPLREHCEQASLQNEKIPLSISISSAITDLIFAGLAELTHQIEDSGIQESPCRTATWEQPFQIQEIHFLMKCCFHKKMKDYEITLISLDPISIPIDDMPPRKVKVRKYVDSQGCKRLMGEKHFNTILKRCPKDSPAASPASSTSNYRPSSSSEDESEDDSSSTSSYRPSSSSEDESEDESSLS